MSVSIDFGNKFLNKDRALYTLVVLKAGVNDLTSLANLGFGAMTGSEAGLQILLNTFLGLGEFGYIALNRVILESSSKNKAEMGIWSATLNTFLSFMDVVYSSGLNNQPEVLELARVNIPVAAVITNNPLITAIPTRLQERIVTIEGLHTSSQLINVGIPLGLYIGLWYTNMTA